MSKYMATLGFNLRCLQILSKRPTNLPLCTSSLLSKIGPNSACLHCQKCICHFPVSASETEQGTANTADNDTPIEKISNQRSKNDAQIKQSDKDFDVFNLNKANKQIKNPSKYFEKKFLKHKLNSVNEETPSNSDQNLSLQEVQSFRIKKISDTFGTYAQSVTGKAEKDMRNPNERLDETLPEDLDEPRDPRLDIPLTRFGRIGKKSFFYNRQMARLGREGKIKEAMAVFEEQMLLRDRVKPSKRTFITLIGILGRVGYTKKAFELFTKMKHLGLDPEDHIYTSLFNACANSPFPEEGLRKAEDLLWSLQDRGITPNIYTIKAAMKAFSMCGGFPMAFRLMDKASGWLKLDVDCFNHLLIASIADKSKGLYRALQVWQKMNEYRVIPNTSTYNLLLRCVRDCGIGDIQEFTQYLGLESPKSYLKENVALLGDFYKKKSAKKQDQSKLMMLRKSVKQITDSRKPEVKPAEKKDFILEVVQPDNTNQSTNDRNLLEGVQLEPHSSSISQLTLHSDLTKSSYLGILSDPGKISDLQVHQSSKVSLSDLKCPEGRLAALGGIHSVFHHMASAGAGPSIETYALLLSCVPNNQLSEFELLAHMERSKLQPDTDFLNDILIRRFKRQEIDTMKDILPVMSRLRLTPNMRTFAAMALTCSSEREAQDLLDDIKAANLEPTCEVMNHFLASSRMNYNYKLSVLIRFEKLGLKPSKNTIVGIEKTIAKTKEIIIDAEKNKDDNNYFLSPQFQKTFQKFLIYYKQWLQRTELQKEKHPWKAYEVKKDKAVEIKETPDYINVKTL